MADSEPNKVGTDMGGCDVPDVSSYDARQRAASLVLGQYRDIQTMRKREGAQVDTNRIEQTVRKLGLEPRKFENLTSKGVWDVIVDISKEDHSKNAMFVCVITSHGDRRGIYGTDDIGINLKRLMGHLKGDKCPSLAGKPKLFFIQACRGRDTDPGVEVEKTDGGSYKKKKMICTIPTSADFLMSYSTDEDHFAYLNPKKGSCYIRALADELEKCDGQREISIVLQRVTHTVAFTFTSNTDDPSQNKKKQCPCYTSTLTKQLYLDASKKK